MSAASGSWGFWPGGHDRRIVTAAGDDRAALSRDVRRTPACCGAGEEIPSGSSSTRVAGSAALGGASPPMLSRGRWAPSRTSTRSKPLTYRSAAVARRHGSDDDVVPVDARGLALNGGKGADLRAVQNGGHRSSVTIPARSRRCWVGSTADCQFRPRSALGVFLTYNPAQRWGTGVVVLRGRRWLTGTHRRDRFRRVSQASVPGAGASASGDRLWVTFGVPVAPCRRLKGWW